MKCFDDAGVRVWCSSVASGRPSSGGGASSSPSSGGSAPPPREREISRSTPPKELFTSARAVAPDASAKQAAPAEPAEPAEAGNAAPAAPSALPGAVGFQRDAAEDKAEHSPQYLCKFFGERCDEAAAAKSDDDAPACAPNCSHHQRTQQRAQQQAQPQAQQQGQQQVKQQAGRSAVAPAAATQARAHVVGGGGSQARGVGGGTQQEQEGEQDVAPEAADGTTVVVVQPHVDPEDAPPDWSKCKASNPSFPADARANWDLWCVSTCSQSPANCARPELTGAAACVCK